MKTDASQFEIIMQALNLDALPVEDQEEILLDINELVFKGTMVRLIEQMDEKTQDEFDALLSADASEEEIDVFLKKHVPNSDAAVQDTLAELTSDILAVTK